MEAAWRDGKSASLKGTESRRRRTQQDISNDRMLAPPEEMKEKMDVGEPTSYFLGGLPGQTKKSVCTCVLGNQFRNLRKLKGHGVWLLERLTKSVTGDI